MSKYNIFIRDLPKVNDGNFEKFALSLFQYQASYNNIYKDYVKMLGISSDDVRSLNEIPFLPIELFKNHTIKTEDWQEEEYFMSSGTTGQQRSRHYIRNAQLYRDHSQQIFESFYGSLSNYCLLALLPSYLEQGSSSLIAMVDHFIRLTEDVDSGYYLKDAEKIDTIVKKKTKEGKKALLIGVSYALLELAELKMPLTEAIVMETGGMKGRRKEMVREELHEKLQNRFMTQCVHSEYGMTELMSQAYAMKEGLFRAPSAMKIMIRDINDPFNYLPVGYSGGINVIDLGNIHSCAFVETKDIGKLHKNGFFEVLGRFDNSDIRGCNLLLN